MEKKLQTTVEARPDSPAVDNEVSKSPETEHNMETLTTKDNRRLLLRADLVVLTIMTITATLAALDKVQRQYFQPNRLQREYISRNGTNALGYAAIFGIKKDANLQGQEYSWLSAIVYFGFLLMQFPNAWLLTKVRPGKYLAALIIFWGVLLLCMAACHNFAGLATVRFFLGIFEAGQLPTCMILTSVWYRREEHALRTAIWYNTFAGIFGGILSYAISSINGSLSTWKYIFLIYGSVTLSFGILVMFALPDSPDKAWFYNARDREISAIRTAGNQTSTNTIAASQKWKFEQVVEALLEPKYWVIVAFVLAWGIVNAGITNFNPLIISGYGFSPQKTTLMATPQAAVAFVSQVLCAMIAYFVPNVRCLIWILSNIPALAGTIMIRSTAPLNRLSLHPMLTLPALNIEEHRTASLIGVYLLGFYNTSWVMVMSLVASNNGGTTKRSFASVTVALVYSVGNMIGPQFFREAQAPHYPLGIFAMMVAFAIEMACGVMYWILCFLENRRRNRVGEFDPHTEQEGPSNAATDDITDGKNPHFRYAM
ncbi:unnamed protein product [Clonostachys rosea f. rosea IK726]|uniref:Uncharacterized protein n=1 Tax=Clonostachys rosea f. rosea IK726 TaxID=1349383 RepID=A0ACA9U7N0_BIOOC|nr:unnamed protein product [Clonostachys rosea f. rosea IK726]